MEKRGVCPGEGEEPVAGGITRSDVANATKQAAETGANGGPVHANQCCGTDTLSKMADAARDQAKREKEI